MYRENSGENDNNSSPLVKLKKHIYFGRDKAKMIEEEKRKGINSRNVYKAITRDCFKPRKVFGFFKEKKKQKKYSQ